MPPMKRLELHQLLVDTLDTDQVFFQPPETVKLSYPCLIYDLAYIDTGHADNLSYLTHYRYGLTYITRDPDDDNIEKIKALPTTKFDRHFVADNLHHYAYQITMC